MHLNEATSTPRTIVAGVPQGSILGPTLFNIYINDIPIDKNCKTALYADDTGIFTSSWRINTITKRLTNSTEKIRKHLKKWQIKLNESKTEAMLLTKRRPQINTMISVNGKNVEWSKKLKYLGLHIDPKLNFSNHIKHISVKAHQTMFRLYPLFNKRSSLSKNNKLLIYKLCIRPILTYAAPVWSKTSRNHYKKLQIVQNKCLRIIGNYPRYTKITQMHKDLQIHTIEEFILKLTTNFFSQCSINNNELINSIGNYTLDNLNSKYKKYKHKRIKHILL